MVVNFRRSICLIVVELWRPVVGLFAKILCFFLEKRPLTVKFCSERIHRLTERRVVFKFRVNFGKVVRYLPDRKKNKTSPGSPALATAQIAPKICQRQPQTIYSVRSRFHPNRFTFSGIIAEHVNTVETRPKVFLILGWK